MTGCNCGCELDGVQQDKDYGKVLKIVLVMNAIMFFVELIAGHLSQSAALQADAIDFLGDSLNFISALYVLNKPLHWKSSAALIKGLVIGSFGLFVLGNTVHHWLHDTIPVASTMGVVGFLALIVNISSAFLLFHFRKGDSNRNSVWICSRNDAIANALVIAAGIMVHYSSSQLPDLIISFVIAGLALSGAIQIISKARIELHLAGYRFAPQKINS